MALIEATLIYVFDESDHCLMLHRVKKDKDIHEGKWNGLGGKMEAGESPRECAIREAYEESGLRLTDLSFCGHIMFPQFDGSNDWSVFVFRSDGFEGDLIDSPEGNLEWVPSGKILDLNLWEGDRQFLPRVISREKFMAKISYENGVLKNYIFDAM